MNLLGKADVYDNLISIENEQATIMPQFLKDIDVMEY